jgi:hypothetical protein
MKNNANLNKLIESEWDRFRCQCFPISTSEDYLTVEISPPPWYGD